MLTSPTALLSELTRLDADIGLLPGRRVALLGFRDPNQKRVDDNVRSLREAAEWTVVDISRPSGASSHVALAQHLDAPKLAMIVDVRSPLPAAAAVLVRALHDKRDSVMWADGSASAVPGNRILYVVAMGARAVGELSPVLQRIDFMTFLRTS